MDHAIATIDNFTRRAQDRLMTLERDMDKDSDVIAYRKVMSHDPETLAELDYKLKCVKKLQRAEDDVASGKVLSGEVRDWIIRGRGYYIKHYNDGNKNLRARCASILDGSAKNAKDKYERAVKESAEANAHYRRYRAQKRNDAIKTFAVRTVIVVGVGTVVTAGVVLLAAGLGMMLGHAAVDGSTRRRY